MTPINLDDNQKSPEPVKLPFAPLVLPEKEEKERREWVEKRQARFTANCKVCNGTGKVDHQVLDSAIHIPFKCTACDRFHELSVVSEMYWRNVPSEYRFATIDSVQASPKSSLSLERQKAVIDLIKKDPESGYAFFGSPGVGKSVWATALYGRALWKFIITPQPVGYKYFPIWNTSAKAMLDEHTAYATAQFPNDFERRINQPSITAQKITYIRTQQGQVPKLFLAEIDKLPKETEHRRAVLFEILDTLQANGGQLVINSNLTPEEFAEKFGADLWWRVKKMAKVMSLF